MLLLYCIGFLTTGVGIMLIFDRLFHCVTGRQRTKAKVEPRPLNDWSMVDKDLDSDSEADAEEQAQESDSDEGDVPVNAKGKAPINAKVNLLPKIHQASEE